MSNQRKLFEEKFPPQDCTWSDEDGMYLAKYDDYNSNRDASDLNLQFSAWNAALEAHSAEYVKKIKLDQVVAGAKKIEDTQAETIAQLRDDLRTAYMHQQPNEDDPVWYWQGDGYDHPESLASNAVVMIRAEQLRELINDGLKVVVI